MGVLFLKNLHSMTPNWVLTCGHSHGYGPLALLRLCNAW